MGYTLEKPHGRIPGKGKEAASSSTTRALEAFLKKTAIAYRQNLVLFLEFRWYAIAVFFKNASTSRVAESLALHI